MKVSRIKPLQNLPGIQYSIMAYMCFLFAKIYYTYAWPPLLKKTVSGVFLLTVTPVETNQKIYSPLE